MSKIVYTRENGVFKEIYANASEAVEAKRRIDQYHDTKSVITGHVLAGVKRYIISAYQPTYSQLNGLEIK